MLLSITQVIIGVNPCGPLRELETRPVLQTVLAVASRLSQVC